MSQETEILSYGESGVTFRLAEFNHVQDELGRYFVQLEEEGKAKLNQKVFTVAWDTVYQLLSDPAHRESISLFALPPVLSIAPTLSHTNGLSDTSFEIRISGWQYIGGNFLRTSPKITGALAEIEGSTHLIPEKTYHLLCKLNSFKALLPQEKSARRNRLAWAEMRRAAMSAQATLDNYLAHTVVITPHELKLELRKAEINGTRVVEVIPTFEGAPDGWLRAFDGYDRVRDQYDISSGKELVQIIMEPEVVTVLSEIKRMPGRRVAGRRAEAFIHNPFALLGEDATKVIDEERFTQACSEAGLHFSRFTAKTVSDEVGICGASLLIESFQNFSVLSETYHFTNKEILKTFIHGLEDRLSNGMQCYAWQEWDLDLSGDSEVQLTILRNALAEWCRQRILVRLSDVYDLSNYSARIQEIGSDKSYYSPYIARQREDEGWCPENIDLGISTQPDGKNDSIGIKITQDAIPILKDAIKRAKENGEKLFAFPGGPEAVPIEEAEDLINTLGKVSDDVNNKLFKYPDKDVTSADRKKRGPSLVIKPNVERIDYHEDRRRQALSYDLDRAPQIPLTLKSDINILPHQLKGIARLQCLYTIGSEHCRGVLLADDMGLGKTLQLLVFLAHCFENNSTLPPALVVAPVSLLDNWRSEIEKFFKPGTFVIQTLYGASLRNHKILRDEIDKQLIDGGITNFLRPGWRGNSNIILTTYETLRDFEFSLASEQWSIMICDEAQKIKNANALVARAAKKQKVHFKIACTGTPVENTLADLWCLFDFIQPGVLLSLNEFGSRYRRPIEAKTEEQRLRIDELRKLIDPQVIRRTKGDVAENLPKKLIVTSCKSLQMSAYQKQLYSNAINRFKGGSPEKARSNHLGLLLHLKKICADPRPLGQLSGIPTCFEEYASKSPKLRWLVNELMGIREKNEKVIIFTEYRDIQRLIQAYIQHKFGIKSEIINGATSAYSESSSNRQRIIDIFQETPGFGAIILSPLAVGFGVNIQAANHVIHYTRTWNPAKEDQATDRAYRIGQKKDVYVYCPTISDPTFKTFEDQLDRLLEWKRDLSKDMLNGTGDISPGNFDALQDVDGEPVMENRSIVIDDVTKMAPDAFEELCALLWTKQGFPDSYRTPQSGDGGIDVVAINFPTGVLIQAKSSLEDGKMLGWDAVKDVVAGEARYTIKHPKVKFTKCSVTNQYFNSDAISQAKINNVTLINRDDLEVLLNKYPVSVLELETNLVA